MFTTELIEKFKGIETPFYYYDTELLANTLDEVKKHADEHKFTIHYAVKANTNAQIMKQIAEAGFGADCVSGNEITQALEVGFQPEHIVFAGVGKSDKEILTALEADIFCFNSESVQELEVINELAEKSGKTARIALRLNPNVKADTHKYITTGLEENKFGISLSQLDAILDTLEKCKNLNLIGIHFHIGSQIVDMENFKSLCLRLNEIQKTFESKNLPLKHINVGGGLGIDYRSPDQNPITNFASYFKVFAEYVERRNDQEIHFELGRSIVGQCGNVVTKVLYIKEGLKKKFAIVDAGMNDLIRPSLYQAYHKIENLTSESENSEKYDVVGPVCESTDCFDKNVTLSESKRGDLLVIRSAGAYGEVMISSYNLRDRAKAYYKHSL